MSNYCFNPTQSYGDWLTAKRFVRNITDGQEAVELTVSRQTREIVASLDELARENNTAIEELAGDVREATGLRSIRSTRSLRYEFHLVRSISSVADCGDSRPFVR